MKPAKFLLMLAFSLGIGACDSGQEAMPANSTAPSSGAPIAAAQIDAGALLEAALAGEHRSPENRARDPYRHPKETLLFFGLKPDMTVIELWPGAGWYTEVLAPALKDNGKLIAAGFPADSEIEYFRRVGAAYNEKLAGNPAVYGAVTFVPFAPPDYASLGGAGTADMVLTFRNLHNWENAGTLETVFQASYAALKPGGVFGVVEHRANPGTTVEESFKAGYMPQDAVIALAEKVGFTLAETSEINANPADTKDYPEGVWTLPPSYRLGEKDREKYAAIGESDRMTLKFVKPAAR